MKHQPLALANALAVTTAVVFVVCRSAVSLFPDLSMTVAQSWFHGIELTKISSLNTAPSSFVLGIVTATAGTWLVGYIFATVYNYFAKK